MCSVYKCNVHVYYVNKLARVRVCFMSELKAARKYVDAARIVFSFYAVRIRYKKIELPTRGFAFICVLILLLLKRLARKKDRSSCNVYYSKNRVEQNLREI